MQKKISFEGCTLMPGLIDCHTHICLNSSTDPFITSKQGSLATRVLKVAQNAKKLCFLELPKFVIWVELTELISKLEKLSILD